MGDPIGYLADEVKITTAVTPTAGASGATDINGAIIDMAGWDGVLVVVPFGAITAGGVQGLKMQQDTDVAGGTMADLEGTAIAVADDADNTTRYLDLKKPLERYVRVVVTRATQVSTVGGAIYIQYKGRNKPTAAHGSGLAGEKHTAPAEGTA